MTTTADPQFSDPQIVYSLSGFPSFITFSAPPGTPGPNYPPVTFTVSAGLGAPAGSYAGAIVGTPTQFPPRSFLFTVIVQKPDIAVSFGQPSVTLCNNGSVAQNTIELQPINYSGTPQLAFTSVPQGIVLTPSQPQSPPLASAQSIPFTVNAQNAAPGPQFVTLTVTDVNAGINKTASFAINVVNGNFTPLVTPQAATVTAGGAGMSVSASLAPNSCFTTTVVVTPESVPAGIIVTPSAQVLASPYLPVSFDVRAAASMQPGTYSVAFRFQPSDGTPGKIYTTTIIVNAASDFALEAAPPAVSIVAGSSGSVVVTMRGINGFAGPVSITSAAPSGVTLAPSTFTLIVPGTAQSVAVAVDAAAPPGGYTLKFTGTAAGIGSRSATVSLTILPPPDVRLTVQPPAIALAPGGTTTVTVTAIGANGFTGSVAVTASSTPDVIVAPATFVLASGESRQISVTIAPTARAAQRTIVFTGVAPGIGTRTATLQVTIAPPVPHVDTVVPPAVTTGTRSAVVRLIGRNFSPGAMVTSPSSGVIIEQVAVFSQAIIDVTLSVRSDGQAGVVPLIVSNADTGTVAAPATLLVYPQESLAAPLGVTAAAIVFPSPGTLIAAREGVYPRGLLATTGSGTITGVWQLDGVPFDTFTATVAGGLPSEVRSHVPIPISNLGGHTLELVAQSPQRAVSPSVLVVHSVDTASRLTLLAPRDGTILGAAQPTTFRWSVAPGASGYEVEIGPSERATANAAAVRRVRVSNAEWTASARDLQDLGSGILRWRVRPVLPGEVRGEPTDANRFALLPARLALRVVSIDVDAETRRLRVRWTGGAPGALYLLEVTDHGQTVYRALSPREEALLPRTFDRASLGSVRVTGFAPDGTTIGTTGETRPPDSSRLSTPWHIALAQSTAVVTFTRQEPTPGSTVKTVKPRVHAAWSGAARPEDVSLMIDTTDVTAVAEVGPASVTYDSLLSLAAGTHMVRLNVGATPASWTFTVALETAQSAAATAGESGAPPSTPEGGPSGAGSRAATLRTDWVLTPLGTITIISGNGPSQRDDARVQLTSQTDLGGQNLFSKYAADVSFREQLSAPRQGRQESRNWLGQFGGRGGGLLGQTNIGYAVPEFLDQTQLLTLGFARGGVLGKLATPLGVVSGYRTFDSQPAGVVTASFNPQQEIRGVALEAPLDPAHFLLRLISMNVDERPSLYSPGGQGKTLGLFGRAMLSPALAVIVEAARGEFMPSAARRQQGSALRLGLSGAHGTLTYTVTLRRTEAGYVNPANRGFTAGAVSDREGGDATVTKAVGRTSITAQVRHLRGGNSSGSRAPSGRETGGVVSVNTLFTQRVSLLGTVNFNSDRVDADAARSLPGADRRQSGVSVTMAEMPGPISFSETLSYQKVSDAKNPLFDTKMKNATVSAAGSLLRRVTLTALATATQSDASPIIGRTDQWLVSLQPSIALPLSLSLQPRAVYIRVENNLLRNQTKTEQYQALLLWAPPAVRSLMSLQLSSDWNRTRMPARPSPKFNTRYAATMTLRWGAGHGPAAPAANVLPGATPIQPPEKGSSDPVIGADPTRGGT